MVKLSKKLHGVSAKGKLPGFTLVEVLVVISTMTILFGLGFANYRDFSRRQELEGVARMVEGDLRLAQQLAITGRVELTCDSLQGFVFQRGVSENRYFIEDQCALGGGNIIKTVVLPTGITIPGFGGGNRILFRVLGRGVDRNGDTTIFLNQAGSGNSVSITVTEVGEIR